MANVAPNGKNPNFAKRPKLIDQVYPRKSDRKKGDLATSAVVDKQALEQQRELSRVEDEARKEHKEKERMRACDEALEQLKGMQRSDYIGREHILAVARETTTGDNEEMKKTRRRANNGFGKIIRAQYSAYYDNENRRIVKQAEGEKVKGPLEVAIARRDEVGLGEIDPAIGKASTIVADGHATKISDFIRFVDEKCVSDEPIIKSPQAGAHKNEDFGPKVRQVLVGISDYLKQNLPPEANQPE